MFVCDLKILNFQLELIVLIWPNYGDIFTLLFLLVFCKFMTFQRWHTDTVCIWWFKTLTLYSLPFAVSSVTFRNVGKVNNFSFRE